MLKGPQRDVFELSFALPSLCAEEVRNGQADIGIVPVATLLEQDLKIFRGTGIACHGPVRTILMISKVPFSRIGILAVDSGSRTSVLLSRLALAGEHGASPALVAMAPQLRPMLEMADAALIIGDAALLLDPDELRARGLHVADLGEAWVRMSGLPMVFAVWAGHQRVFNAANEAAFVGSCRFGLHHLEEIISGEHARRGITAELAREYLTRHLVLELGDSEYRGMRAFLKAAAELPPAQYIQPATTTSERMIL